MRTFFTIITVPPGLTFTEFASLLSRRANAAAVPFFPVAILLFTLSR